MRLILGLCCAAVGAWILVIAGVLVADSDFGLEVPMTTQHPGISIGYASSDGLPLGHRASSALRASPANASIDAGDSESRHRLDFTPTFCAPSKPANVINIAVIATLVFISKVVFLDLSEPANWLWITVAKLPLQS